MTALRLSRLSRRSLLGRLAGWTALAPFTPLLERDLLAQSGPRPGAAPRRLITYCYPLGTRPELYFPTGSETSFTLGEILSPLAPYQGDLIVTSGINQMSGGGNGPHDFHPMFTASYIQNNLVGYGPAYKDPNVVAKGTSVDQYVAGRIGSATRFPILVLSVLRRSSAGNPSRIDYHEAAYEHDPYAAFDRLFSGLTRHRAARPTRGSSASAWRRRA